MRVWRVTFHWLGKENGSIDVIADNSTNAATRALEIEKKKYSAYRLENIIKIELISEPEELEE